MSSMGAFNSNNNFDDDDNGDDSDGNGRTQPITKSIDFILCVCS